MRILLAIDESSCSSAAIATILKHTAASETEVLVLHVIDPCQLTPATLCFVEGAASAQQYVSLRMKWHAQANALVTQAAERLEASGIKASTLVCEGEPKSAILQEAAQWHADLIVLGSHGRAGMDRFLLGSVSETIAHHAPCSTLIVRPNAESNVPNSGPEHLQTNGPTTRLAS